MKGRRTKFKSFLVIVLSVFLVFLMTLTLLKGMEGLFNKPKDVVVNEPITPVEPEPEPVEPKPEPVEPEPVEPEPEPVDEEPEPEIKKAKIMANGDILVHNLVFISAYDAQSQTYDFNSQFEKVAPLIQSADLAIANFEGTIYPTNAPSGYPVFNAPEAIADAIKNAGYDVMALANNHIVDSRSAGIDSTANAFRSRGLDTVGVRLSSDEKNLIREVNGIKIAILNYAYGFNGMEQTLTQEEYNLKLNPINPEKIKADILEAEKLADITIVLPHMGIEYMLEPNQEQITLFDNMIEWGADIIFGNHPHVIQPTKVVSKDGQDKFILYSMGNFLSNQRLETVENIWTERGVVMELNITKEEGQSATIDSIVGHPTWVYRGDTDKPLINGIAPKNYHVIPTTQVVNNTLDMELDEATKQRIIEAHAKVIEHLNIQPLQGGQE